MSLETKLLALDHNQIRREVGRVLDKLPRQFRKQLHNIEIVVEERPGEELLLDAGLDPGRDTLYGLYQGVPLPDRSALYPPILPDKITIFSEPLLRDFPDPDDLREQIRTTDPQYLFEDNPLLGCELPKPEQWSGGVKDSDL
jgi:predicted Zn-dependent protease with MMP-like domain